MNQALRVISNLLAAGALQPKAVVDDVIPAVFGLVLATLSASSSQVTGFLTKVFLHCYYPRIFQTE